MTITPEPRPPPYISRSPVTYLWDKQSPNARLVKPQQSTEAKPGQF
jgi:hypothetical protein